MSRKRRKRGRILWLSLLLLLSAGLMVGGGIWSVAAPVGQSAPVLVVVEPGEKASQVALSLQDNGLIRNANTFLAAAYLTGKWKCIQAGRHELDSSMSALDIMDALCRGSRTAWRWLTIPEGYDLRQVADKIEQEGLGDAGDFQQAASEPWAFEAGFPLPADSLEGYLFPDTYRVDVGETAPDIIGQMLRRFDEVVWKGLFDRKAQYNGRSMRDILILASLVEWEAQKANERAAIAGVLLNRLRRGQKLECDATVQYALGDRRKSRLTFEDLAVESEYNTYLHEGLPPRPICNPGEASIRAVLNPAKVPYLYYVARPDGSHVFSTTFREHQAAVARVRRGNAR